MSRQCWTTRDQFLDLVGVVNADIKLSGRYTVRYSTKYTLVATRIRMLAISTASRFLYTVTDDGTHVVTVKGFYNGKGRAL